MSESPATARRRPGPQIRQALTLCLTAAAPDAAPARVREALDSLEALLPTLDAGDIDALLDDPDYDAVRGELLHRCASTWLDRESGLARRVLAGPPASTLQRLFGGHIPREAYADELAVLDALRPERILILGSGPCPMSAIVIQEAFPGARITALDRSPEACTLAARLLAASGYSIVEVRHGDAAEPGDIGGYDCILMALTVGEDEAAKRRIIDALARAADPHAILVVRTAVGWGRVLYPRADHPGITGAAARQPVHTLLQRSVAVPVRIAELRR